MTAFISDKDLEEAVLGALLVDKEGQVIFFNMVQNLEVFYEPAHYKIAQAIKVLYDAQLPIDILTVAESLKKSGSLKEVGGASAISKIAGKVSGAAHIEIHISLLLEKYLKRGVSQFASKLLTTATSETSDVFEQITQVQSGLEKLLGQALVEKDVELGEILEQEALRWEQENLSGLAGMSCGIKTLDALTGGLCNSDFIVVGARPGQGKTALVLSILRNLCLQDISCGIFSLEMSKNQLIQRLLAQQSSVNAYKIKVNNLDKWDRIRLFEACQTISRWPLKINDDAGMSLRRLRTKAMIWKKKFGIKFLVVDYIQLMNAEDKKMNREAAISEISRGLKVLAKDLDIPVLGLSQLSRAVESRPDKTPQLSDLRESGAIEQDADQIWFLMRPAYYSMEGSVKIDGVEYPCDDVCILDVAKFRAGETKQIPLKFTGQTMLFSDYL